MISEEPCKASFDLAHKASRRSTCSSLQALIALLIDFSIGKGIPWNSSHGMGLDGSVNRESVSGFKIENPD